MPRLIGVSNRTAAGGSKAGGLAVALWEALVKTEGLWFGWSGDVVSHAPRGVELFEEEGVEFAVTDLTEAEHEGYYLGYSNRALWPVLPLPRGPGELRRGRSSRPTSEVNRRFAKLVHHRA